MIAVVDYGMGNLHSMAKALEYVGEDVVVTADAAGIEAADRIVLPGVGAFGECMANLAATGLLATLEREVLGKRKPFLGVCVGMQLLATVGEEHGEHRGLGWIPGRVSRLPARSSVRVPHTGWNDIAAGPAADGSPFATVRPGEDFYFNHSYRFMPDDAAVAAALCQHGDRFVAGLVSRNIVAVQFHPEKSQRAGIDFLADFTVWNPQPSLTSTP